MPDFGPPGEPPFEGMGFLGDLMRMIQAQGPVSWDAARQLAISIAVGGETEGNVDPIERMKLEQLARVAELHVEQATGLPPSRSGRGIRIVPVNRGQWIAISLDAYRPVFETLAASLTTPKQPLGGLQGLGLDDAGAPDDAWLGNIMQMLGPMLLGMTAGSMLGHLGRRAFGQYDLPLPRPASDDLLLVVPNLNEFGDAWSLPPDDLRLWVSLHEVTHHAVLSVPHVHERLTQLVMEYVAAFEPTVTPFEDRLGEIDLGDPNALNGLQDLLGDPEVVLGAIQSDRQRRLLPQLEALVAAIVGYVDYVMDTIGQSLIGSYPMLTEALRRRRVTADPSDRFVERLFGLELSQAQYDRGAAFVDGVVERAGADGLRRLWESDRELPTPAEIDAPGLWLARIDLPDDVPADPPGERPDELPGDADA